MPELPEVEVVRRGLVAKITNRKILNVIVRREGLRWPFPSDLREKLLHQRVANVERRGKYLLISFEHPPIGQPLIDVCLLVHLGMTGSMVWHEASAVPAVTSHDHLDIEFEGGLIRYNDPRRFGAVLFGTSDPADHVLLHKLGAEPFGDQFSAAVGGKLLFTASRGRSVPVKQFLLAGHAVVGVGNIYCSETLFRAGVRPTRAAGRVTLKEYSRLAEAIRQTLSEAIEKGGSTLRDFKNSAGESGYFQLTYAVYDRAGEACRRCDKGIKLVRQQQRASFYCPSCQK
jgi:formamidopyrimidine-DNA glycosylase